QGHQGGVAQIYARPHRDDRNLGEADAARAADTTRSRATTRAYGGSATRCDGSGSSRFGGVVKTRVYPGSATSGSLIASSRQSRCYTRCLFTASTPKPEGGARCVSSARRDLAGGRGAILVPTGTRPDGCKRKQTSATAR